jgi:hypothetical protein
MAPFQRTAESALETAVQGARVALQTVVVVVAPYPDMPLPVERASRQMPVLFEPCRSPSARRVELLARGVSLDARHALTVWPPVQRASQKRAVPPHAGMDTTAAQEVGLVWGDLEVALLQPVGSYPIKPFRIVLVPEGADPVIRLAAQPCLAATVRLHYRVEPPIQGIVQIGSKDGALPPCGGTSPPSALR